MELWIRSQDKKTLSIAKNIKLDRYLGDKENVIISNDFFEIGKYKTEKRALEVLDEIQNILKPKYILNTSSIKPNGDYYEKNGGIYQDYSADARIEQLNIYVYEMPED